MRDTQIYQLNTYANYVGICKKEFCFVFKSKFTPFRTKFRFKIKFIQLTPQQ